MYSPTQQDELLGEFINFDTIDFYITGTSGAAPRSSGSYAGSSDIATLVGQLAVTYTYTPSAVPEPVSLVVLSTGLIGLCLTRRCKPDWKTTW